MLHDLPRRRLKSEPDRRIRAKTTNGTPSFSGYPVRSNRTNSGLTVLLGDVTRSHGLILRSQLSGVVGLLILILGLV